MISRDELGLIIAGRGATSGVLSRDVYTAIIVMVTVTTIITPICIKKTYKKINNINLIIYSQNKLYI
jgi:Kef-type K+ transport system membrane component KefB